MDFEYVVLVKRYASFVFSSATYPTSIKIEGVQLHMLPRYTRLRRCIDAKHGSGGLHRRYNCMEIKSSPYREAYLCPRYGGGRGGRGRREPPLWVDEEWEGGEKGARGIYASANITLNRSLLWKFP